MAHVQAEKKKVIARIKKIRGQLDAVERAIDQEKDCYSVLQTLSACRGGLNGLIGELIEGHVTEHIMAQEISVEDKNQAALDLIKIMKTYWK